ncbi:WecB UDP-N-acetylglucosamine 2-epimerase [Candidatus Nanopelagicaceae bacterium]
MKLNPIYKSSETKSVNNKKRISFLTGTRADYGKIKSLLSILNDDRKYQVDVLVTGMHLLPKYGETVSQVMLDGLGQIHLLPNQSSEQAMEVSLAKTIEQLSNFIQNNMPDLLVVHGDRIEALAGAIVGALRNVPVAHIEGGEVSGTIDGLIRHSISKLAHIHFVANEEAKSRLMQLGENEDSIYIIGSPDVDIMFSKELPGIEDVKQRYEIPFSKYAILTFHPVTTELKDLQTQIERICTAIINSEENFVVIKSNNDLGSEIIQKVIEEKLIAKNFKHLPSMRFEYFLTLMKNSQFMVGNSSAGVRETTYYGVPSINIGSRQRNRNKSNLIIDVNAVESEILVAISKTKLLKRDPQHSFGDGKSDQLFKEILDKEVVWPITTDKVFVDME